MPRTRLVTLAGLLVLALIVPGLSHGQNGPGKDQYGDSLPNGALARAGSLRWRHGGAANFVVFLPDGKRVLTVAEDKTVRVWEYPSGKLIRQFGPGLPTDANELATLERQVALLRAGGTLQAAALDKDGKTLAVNFDGGAVKFYDVDSGKEKDGPKIGGTSTPRGLGAPAFAFDPDGKHLATLEPTGKIRIFDRETGKEVQSFGSGAQVLVARAGSFLSYSPDGKRLVSLSNDVEDMALKTSLKFWEPSGKALNTVVLNQGFFGGFGASFSPDSKLLAYWSGDAVKVIDVATGKEHRTLKEANGPRRSTGALLFGKDSKTLFTMNQFGQLKEWDTTAGTMVRTLFEVPQTSNGRPQQLRTALLGSGSLLALSPDGDVLAVGGQDNVVHFIDLKTGKELPLAGSAAPLQAVRFTADGKLVTEAADLGVRRFDAGTGKDLGAVKLPEGTVAVALSPDGSLALTHHQTGKLVLLETATGKEVASAGRLQREPLTAIAFSEDGKTLAVRWILTQAIEVYDVPSLKLRSSFAVQAVPAPQPGQPRQPTVIPPLLVLSGDGKLLAAYSDATTLTVYHTSGGQKLADLTGLNQQIVRTAVFAPDNRCLATDLGGNTVIVFELATGTVRQTLATKAPPVQTAPPQRVLGGFGGTTPIAASQPRVAFSPDGRRLAFAAPDRAVHVWDLATGKEVAEFKGHTGAVMSVAFAPGGKQLASASADTTALVWDLSTVAVTAPAPRELPPYLMAATWEQLKDSDGARAFAAINDLAAAPRDAVPALAAQLKPAAPVDAKLIEQLVADLDHESYKVRQKAQADLLKIGERAVPYIDKVLAASPALEMKTRLENVRAKLTTLVLAGDRLREYRAIEVLERIGTPEAQKVLQTLADGAPGALTTETARGALERLKR